MLDEQLSHNLERDPVLEQKAREYELSLISERLETYSPGELENMSNPGFIFTPAEHKMFGSTSYGLGFFPNQPYALFAKKSLNNINQKREELNKQDLQLPMPINIDGKPMLAIVKFLPLEEGVVGQEIPKKTFEIKHFTDFSGNEVAVDKTDLNRAELEIEKMQLEAQKNEQELYFRKITF